MKQKHWQVSVFDKTSEIIKDDTFYTTDTEAYLVFELIDEDFIPDSAMVTVYNIYGKAIINVSVEVADGIVRYEMPEKAIGHSGGWRTQVIFTKDNEDYTTRIIEFDVGGHLLGNKKPPIVEIENWNSLIEHAGELIDDWEQLEEIRQVNEQQRELAESARQNEFEANETSRQTNELVREEAENNRQSTFETNETERQNEFETNEDERESTFEINESTRQANELARVSAESVRVTNEEERELNEAERISKDSERDSKIDSKADKSMLLNPKYDLVYDSCVRDVTTPLDAYSTPMESGHYFVNVDKRETDTILTYEPEGVIIANPASNNSFSPVLIEDFEVYFPYINVRFNNVSLSHVNRSFYIKYLNKQNWIRVNAGTNTTVTTTCIDGVETEIGRQSNPLNNDFGERYGLVQDVHISYRQAHTLASPSGKVVVVRQNDREPFVVGVPIEVVNLFDKQGKVGFDVWGRTEILNFKAGRVR